MKKKITRCLLTVLILVLFGGAMLVLNHEVKNGRKTEAVLPPIADTPVYVECEEGKKLEIFILPKEDLSLSGFQAIMVNLSEENAGTIHFSLMDSNKDILMDQVMTSDSIPVGEWFSIPAETVLLAGEEYVLTVVPKGCAPYFIQSPLEGINRSLPFEERVAREGMQEKTGVSLGVVISTQIAMTFGEIFYYSVPICMLAAFIALLLLWAGKERIFIGLKKIPFGEILKNFGNDIFLFLLFTAVCMSIYDKAVVQGVFITSDSAGYLREAVNMVNGNGFSYDKMAGYDSWFANWPILYPAFIAFTMLITGQNAYLASKILSAILVGIILIVLRVCFKRDAWVYALALTNIGFLSLSYYTWSELPFILFMLCFGLVLAKILMDEKVSVKWYVLLGVTGICCFLTRYYGIYVWFVSGLYILLLLLKYKKEKDILSLKKGGTLMVTSFISGCISLGYLLMNKVMNGMASGVSRSMWWDDYESLTNDLIESLLTELFNAFSLQIPQVIEAFPYHVKALLLIVVLIGFAWFAYKNCKHFTRESVMITMAVVYYGMFICIRYFSSMDTFYFRFFEPASFLFSIGMTGLFLPYVKGKKGFQYFGGMVTALVVMVMVSMWEGQSLENRDTYYETLIRQWDNSYAEIPEKSVIIFNDIDFRSTWYRSDVVDGTITPEDTWNDIKNTYYGSDYLCIRKEFAKTMLEEGSYDESVRKMLQEGIQKLNVEQGFLVVALK